MIPYPKNLPYRNQRLRDLAEVCPQCMYCGAENRGDVVMAHSNSLQDGKGMGTKADDIPCYLCSDCHNLLDGRTGNLPRDEQRAMHREAAITSFLWLLKSGHLRVIA